MPTFAPTVNPDWGYVRDRKPKVLEVPFGDGYEVTAKDGINNNPITVNFKWGDVDETERDLIINFLDARGGSEVFVYTIPDELTARNFKCKVYNDKYFALDAYEVTATFEEKFLP